jgi:hypothetical protein
MHPKVEKVALVLRQNGPKAALLHTLQKQRIFTNHVGNHVCACASAHSPCPPSPPRWCRHACVLGLCRKQDTIVVSTYIGLM